MTGSGLLDGGQDRVPAAGGREVDGLGRPSQDDQVGAGVFPAWERPGIDDDRVEVEAGVPGRDNAAA
jgi:hypothetical protein